MPSRDLFTIFNTPEFRSLHRGHRFSVKLDRIEYGGALHDPVAALVFCSPVRADNTIINGRVIVRDGRITTLDLPRAIERQNRLALELARG